ncbi:methyltransferase [Acuticoccus sp.]|uniref:methyltransferase n=1 Tax=Acuticoccus sp. TaxID=1904378 RepID=UPI003B520A47
MIDRFLELRDRALANPDVLARASGTWLGRQIARREARALFDVTAGFVYSQVLRAAVELDLLAILLERPIDVAQLAERLDLTAEAALALLVAAEPLRLVEPRRGGRWGLGRRGAALLGNPGAIAMVRHHDLFYRELADPVALLRRGHGEAMSRFWPYARGGSAVPAGAEEAYSQLMAASQAFVAREVLAAVSLRRHARLLDVGGGDGVFARAAAERHPHLEVTVLDLAPVAARAAERLADLGPRVRAVAGDFLVDPLPRGADVVTLVRVVHDHDDARAATLLRRCHDALPAGGTLVLAEPMAGRPAAPGLAPYFSFYLFAMGSGRPRTARELIAIVRAAGFVAARLRSPRNPTACDVLVAHKARVRSTENVKPN